jgi:hypothetical protein
VARARALLTILAVLCAVLIGGTTPAQASGSTAAAFSLPLDLHNGSINDFDGTYYAYGEMESCGFQWYQANTTWCGLGVSTAPSLNGPWTTPTLLFSAASTDPWTGQTWQVECGSTGQGCWNPHMIQRTGWGSNDGVYILWFSSPLDYSRNHANAYNALGCNSPAGPCGPAAGAPHGSYAKPSLSVCAANGDFGIINSSTTGQTPAIICTMPGDGSLSIEQLNQWGVGGTGTGESDVAGLSSIEGPGGWYDTASSTYVITYSDPGCGYCAGTGTGYATASSLLGPYTAPVNVSAASTTPATGRRDISATSCGGQPRTVSVVDGQPYQGIDLWTGGRNETSAGVLYAPLTYTPGSGTPGDGNIWTPPVSYPC